MENFQNSHIFSAKSFNNEKKEKDEFEQEILNNKLNIRKKRLYQILLQKRQNNIIQIQIKDKALQLKEVSILINKNIFEEIQNGLNKFYDFLVNYDKLEKVDIKYIYENIYYRLLDLISCEKKFDKNQHMNKIFFLINYLTTENNIFIGPITEYLFLSNLKEMIEVNKENNFFISIIIPVLSNMLINRKKFNQIMKEIDVIKIIKIKISQNYNNKENIEQLLILLNNFIINIKENKTNKFQFILEYVLTLLNNDIINYLHTKEESLILLSIFDILIYMAKDTYNLTIIQNSNCIQFIKLLIDNIYKSNLNINSNIYLIKSEELLSNILLSTKNFKDKQNIISYLYSNLYNNNNLNLPFVYEFKNSIGIQDFNLAYVFLKCIVSLVNNCSEYSELFCSNDFIKCLIKLFSENIQKKIKNEIITFFINIIENNNNKVYKYLLNSEILSILVTYLNNKKKSSKESTQIIIYNILLFFKKCLSFEEENNFKEIKNILDKYKYKEIIEYLIESEDESISDMSRDTFIKYFSESENVYIPNKIKNKIETKEEDMVIE